MRWLLLPAFDGTGEMFADFARELGGQFDTVPVSYPDEGPQDYATLAGHVVEEWTGDRDCAVLGESFAGPLAFEVARRLGSRCRAAVFVATYLRNPSPTVLKLLGVLPARLVSFFVSRPLVHRKVSLGSGADRALARRVARNFGSADPGAVKRRLRTIGGLDGLPGGRLEMPCLYIQASEDRLVPAERLADLEATCTDLEIHRVDGGHFILQAAPQECAEIVRAKFGGWRAAPGGGGQFR